MKRSLSNKFCREFIFCPPIILKIPHIYLNPLDFFRLYCYNYIVVYFAKCDIIFIKGMKKMLDIKFATYKLPPFLPNNLIIQYFGAKIKIFGKYYCILLLFESRFKKLALWCYVYCVIVCKYYKSRLTSRWLFYIFYQCIIYWNV